MAMPFPSADVPAGPQLANTPGLDDLDRLAIGDIAALPPDMLLALQETALAETAALTADWTFEEVEAQRNAVPSGGLKTPFRSGTLRDVAREALKIARGGMSRRQRLNEDGFDETSFLAPLEEIVARGTTAAEEMLSAYHTRWGSSIEPVFMEEAY